MKKSILLALTFFVISCKEKLDKDCVSYQSQIIKLQFVLCIY